MEPNIYAYKLLFVMIIYLSSYRKLLIAKNLIFKYRTS